MNTPPLLAICLAICMALAILFAGRTANAFECSRYFTTAEVAIDRTVAKMKRSGRKLDRADKALIYGMIDDARMYLTAARANHRKPRRPLDHARAMIKAHAATGAAHAAELLHDHFLKRLIANTKARTRALVRQFKFKE